MTSYGNKLFISCLLLVGLCALSHAEEAAPPQADNSNQEQNLVEKEIVAPPSFPSDIGLPSVGSLATGAAVAVGTLAVFFMVAVAAWPIFGLRACNIFGTCGADYNTYNSVGTPYNNDAYTYSAQPPYTSTSYQKRAISRRRRTLH